ncbi:MAG: c-type cytochrome biogenesis protein CcmI [Alphaproteobacteria bacterium]|nr:c-type cytochrome biogenesis protein CcmI [Alphaproteobacteria bacterium]
MSLGLAIALIGLTSLALAILLVPLLLRRQTDLSRESYNLAVYRDQLAEVERDAGRGLIGAEQAEAARAEIGRRILALAPRSAVEPPKSSASFAVAAITVLLLPFAAWLLYARLGMPGLPDEPFAERAAAAKAVAGGAEHLDLGEAIAKIGAHLKEHPEDLTGWLLLARTQVSLGQYAEAVEAYRHAADLSGHRPDIMGDWGEAQVLAANGTVTPEAREAFETALADKESAPRSRYYLALAKAQQGDTKAALQGWVDLAADAPADAEWLPLVRQRIAEAAAKIGVDPANLKTSSGMPSPAAVAATAQATANASPEERRAMIEGMVGKLATRLEQQPDDVEGWARLGRSYMVLGDAQKARDAYARAVKLKPDDAALKEAYAEASRAAEKTDGK